MAGCDVSQCRIFRIRCDQYGKVIANRHCWLARRSAAERRWRRCAAASLDPFALCQSEGRLLDRPRYLCLNYGTAQHHGGQTFCLVSELSMR
jgi:hypothetical protein